MARRASEASRASVTSRGPRLYPIGEIASKLGLSADTLRYYEKIGLLPHVARQDSGARLYHDKDLSRLRFIQRAQKMDFTLAEIGTLLKMRDAPQSAHKAVRDLTARKLTETEAHLGEMKTLRDELRLLLNLCNGSRKGCGILKEMDRR